MITTFTTGAKIAITPTLDESNGAPFGLSGGMSAAIEATGDQAFLIRTFYPEFTNYDTGSGSDDAFKIGAFPGLGDYGEAGTPPVPDWNGQALSMVTLKAIAIEIKALQAYAGTAATGVLTSDATNVSDAQTVTIGSTVYRFKTTMAAAYDVKLGATAAISLSNLAAAIGASGTPGTEYYTGTLIHPNVTVTGFTATTVSIAAARTGDAGNSIATTETSTHLSWGSATLTGGEDVTQPAVARDFGGTVTINLDTSLMPGSSGSVSYEVSAPCLFTFALPEGWTPDPSGMMNIKFNNTGGGPLTDKDVNAVVTVALIGSTT